MTRKLTGAERYFAAQMRNPEDRVAYEAAGQAIDGEQAVLGAGSDSNS